MTIKTIFAIGFMSLFSLSSVSEFKRPVKQLPYQKVTDSLWAKENRLKSLEDENLCIEHDIYVTAKSIIE